VRTSSESVGVERAYIGSVPGSALRIEATHQRAAFADATGKRSRKFGALPIADLLAQYGLQIAVLADEPFNPFCEVTAFGIKVQLQTPGDLAVDLLDAQSQFTAQFGDKALAFVPHNLRVHISLSLPECKDADPESGHGE
jgi:hypothetical protein